MKKMFLAFLAAFLGSLPLAQGQDLPPLPDMGSTGTTVESQPVEAVEENNEEAEDKAKEEKKAAKEREKKLKKLNKERKKQGLEPLTHLPEDNVIQANPADSGLPPLPGEAPSGAGQGAGLPPLPGEESSTAAGAAQAGGLPPLPGEEGAAPGPAAALPGSGEKPKGTKAKKPRGWVQPDFGPNTMFGGWVRTRSTDVQTRLAWASQEVLNAMDLAGFKFIKEDGRYAGQRAEKQWREFSFKRDKSDIPVYVYVEPARKNLVWMRVGPPEPPAGVPAARVKKIRAEHQKALSVLKKKLGKRISPHRKKSWEAPYKRPRTNLDFEI